MKYALIFASLLFAHSSHAICTASQIKELSIAGAKSLYSLTFKKQPKNSKLSYVVNGDAPITVSQGDNTLNVSVTSKTPFKNSDGQTEYNEYARIYEVLIQSYEDTPCDIRSVTVLGEAG